MDNSFRLMHDVLSGCRRRSRAALFGLACYLCTVLSGCAALTNPVADGLPVDLVPPELLAESKEGMVTIPLSLLGQPTPEVYRLGPRDVLGIWIEGVLGERNQVPPVHFPETGVGPPSLGFPIPVREDGTIVLPLIGPMNVSGMTIDELHAALRKAYTETKKVLLPGQERLSVTLLRKRQYHVLVIRQDSTGPVVPPPGTTANTRAIGFTLSAAGTTPGTKRGTGYAIELNAYENDVLNALAITGGLPGLDAVNEVVIERGAIKGTLDREKAQQALDMFCPDGSGAAGTRMIRIPLRYRQGNPPTIKPEDVILQDGDIVFIEARDAELFYTGGLLPPGEYVLPRDHDLDVAEAIVRVGGPVISGGINTININGALVAPGLGIPSPSLVTVLRRTPAGGRVAIRVNLGQTLRDPYQRILVQKGDMLILQEEPSEAIVRYITQMLNFDFLGTIIRRQDLTATATLRIP
jgi:protein involved in polysaccharide export with SLBB domain